MSRERVVERIKEDIAKQVDDVEVEMLEDMQYSLADAILEGSQHSKKAVGWGKDDKMCAMTAAYAATKARGYTS